MTCSWSGPCVSLPLLCRSDGSFCGFDFIIFSIMANLQHMEIFPHLTIFPSFEWLSTFVQTTEISENIQSLLRLLFNKSFPLLFLYYYHCKLLLLVLKLFWFLFIIHTNLIFDYCHIIINVDYLRSLITILYGIISSIL